MANTLNLRPIADLLGSIGTEQGSILGSVSEHAGSVGLLAVDLVETANCLELRVGLPSGIGKSDLGFSLEGNKMKFFAKLPKKSEENEFVPSEGMPSDYRASHMESAARDTGEFNSWYREVDFPIPVDVSKLGASFEHGMLSICIPLTLGIKPENINISDSKMDTDVPEHRDYASEAGEKVQEASHTAKRNIDETTYKATGAVDDTVHKVTGK